MFFDGSLYVAAPPSIWKLTDTDGDGVAERVGMVSGQNAHWLRERPARPLARARWLDLLVQRRVCRADPEVRASRHWDQGRPHFQRRPPAGSSSR